MINLKILLLGKGVANNGCERVSTKHNIDYDYLEKNEVQISDYDLIVKSPGIPLDDIVFTKIKGKVITDIELAYRLEKPNLIGVTGSNGKTTVVTMLEHVLKSKYNTSMQEWNVRKVNLSEAGLVVYRSKILKDRCDVENS